MNFTMDAGMVMSGVSLVVTTYFWLVKARKERPYLQFHQLTDFRAICRRVPGREGVKRLCLQQLGTGGVLIVNHSTRQNSIISFDCFLPSGSGVIQGDWGYSDEDKPPWNLGPESTIAFSPACFFDVPEDFEVPENIEFRMRFYSASGKHFDCRFTRQAPRSIASTRRAA